jgi:hypothetical protein
MTREEKLAAIERTVYFEALRVLARDEIEPSIEQEEPPTGRTMGRTRNRYCCNGYWRNGSGWSRNKPRRFAISAPGSMPKPGSAARCRRN